MDDNWDSKGDNNGDIYGDGNGYGNRDCYGKSDDNGRGNGEALVLPADNRRCRLMT